MSMVVHYLDVSNPEEELPRGRLETIFRLKAGKIRGH